MTRTGRPGSSPARTIAAALVVLVVAAGCAGTGKKKQSQMAPPEEVFRQALAKIEKKKYYTARNLLQSLLPRVPPDDRDLLPKIQLAIADAYFKDGGLLNYGEALNGYRNFLTYFPDHPQADHAQFMVAMSLYEQVLAPDRDQALTLKAIDEFRKVESVFPDSLYVEKARRKIQDCYGQLAEHERLVGRFYQRRKAWNAAIDRYRNILIQYPRFEETPQVLFDLGVCLLKIGRRTEAEAFFDRLAREAPQDGLIKKAEQALARDAHRRKKEEESQP